MYRFPCEHTFPLLWDKCLGRIAVSGSKCTVTCIRNWESTSQSGHVTLPSQHQRPSVPVASHPRQHLVLSVFLPCCCYLVSQSCPTLCDLMDWSPLSMEFSGQEHWSGSPFPSSRGLPNPGIQHESSALADRFFTTEPPGKPISSLVFYYYFLKIFFQPHGLSPFFRDFQQHKSSPSVTAPWVPETVHSLTSLTIS